MMNDDDDLRIGITCVCLIIVNVKSMNIIVQRNIDLTTITTKCNIES